METYVANYNVYTTHLYPLSKANDFKVASEYPDVRGWDIVGGDGLKLGKVHDLIVDIEQKRVRYLDVDLKKDLFPDNKRYQILIPLGVAILNRDDHNVIVTQITKDSLPGYPMYVREPIYVVRSYENAVRDYYNNGHGNYHRDSEFYNHEFYDDKKFYIDKE